MVPLVSTYMYWLMHSSQSSRLDEHLLQKGIHLEQLEDVELSGLTISIQPYYGSILQSKEHPSLLLLFPSSHSSPTTFMVSPQKGTQIVMLGATTKPKEQFLQSIPEVKLQIMH